MEIDTSITLIIILGLILLGAGFGLGFLLGQRKSGIEPLVCPPSLLDLKLLQNWTAFAKGEIKEASNRNLILISNGETIEIFVPEEATILSPVPGTTEVKELDFDDIKAGNRAGIQVIFAPEGKTLIGNLITILP